MKVRVFAETVALPSIPPSTDTFFSRLRSSGLRFQLLQATEQPRHPMQRVPSKSTELAPSELLISLLRYAFSMLHRKLLDSGMLVLASPTCGVRTLPLSPVTRPA